jgi:ABC-type Zn uptake system ZnuABC Zn-binding protein ZnuA
MRIHLPLTAALLCLLAGGAAAEPLRAVATVPDLGDLLRQVGADQVEVTVLTKGPQDPHFVEPRPSFIRKLHRADLFLLVGLELEIGWAPVLLRQARNPEVQPGTPGYLDASVAIAPLEVPTAPVDRSMGDVHPGGNPHYLTDPLNGLRVAHLIRDRLIELRPGGEEAFRSGYQAFATRLVAALVGAPLVERHGAEPLARRVADGSLGSFLDASGERQQLGGWLAAMAPHAGTRAVQDHRLWPYFARRFGLELIGTLEPRPGIAPTTRHLARVVERVERENARLVLASPYFDPRHARWVAEHSQARVVEMAHQVGSREGTSDYLATVDHNVRRVLEAL